MNGVIYLAIGEQHYQEALVSARSVKGKSDASICLVTDIKSVDGIFDIVQQAPGDYDPEMKIQAMMNSPFDKTLFLDTDTYICVILDDIFATLDTFDVAIARQYQKAKWRTKEPVPATFPELNSGVLAYKKSKRVDEMLSGWLKRYLETEWRGWIRGDQGALREELYLNSNLRLCVMPPEFNFRFNEPAVVGGAVYILHGRPSGDYEHVRQAVNTEGRVRIWQT